MLIFLKPIVIAIVITILAIYILRPFALQIGLVDSPGSRKHHEGTVPLIGGIAIFLGVFFGVLLSSIDLNNFNFFLISTLIILLVGIIDDHSNMSVNSRLTFQLVIALIAVTLGGVTIESLGNLLGQGEIILNHWSILFSVIAIIAAINAVNMADGIHGLAGGNSLVSFLAISYLSINSTSQSSLLISLLFCVVLPVFLVYNLCFGLPNRMRIFMGDAGSMFIGLSLAWVLLDFSQGESRSFSPVIALWFFALPLLELSTSILRRLFSGASPFKPDRFHTHHLMLKLGFSERLTLMIMLIFSIIMAVIGVLGELYVLAEYLMFIGFILVFLIYFVFRRLALKKVNNQ